MWKVILGCALLGGCSVISIVDCVTAQIIPDQSAKTRVKRGPRPNTRVIEGGTQVGQNLFHSFRTLSIAENDIVRFRSRQPIQSIFARVTGRQMSDLQGTLQSLDTNANFILLNPNGILFGEKFKLNVGGSFLATTAESVVFRNGAVLSAKLAKSSDLLKLSVPIGLQFGPSSGPIEVRTGDDSLTLRDGLKVRNFKDLALIGGDIRFNQGKAIASGGNIWLGSIKQPGRILWKSGRAWEFTLPAIAIQGNIFLDNSSRLISGFQPSSGVNPLKESGSIVLLGDTVKLRNSVLNATNLGDEKGGNIVIDAAQSIELLTTEFSNTDTTLNTGTLAQGESGDITLEAQTLILISGTDRSNNNKDQTRILTSSLKDNDNSLKDDLGSPGIITLNIPEIELRNDSIIEAATSNNQSSKNKRVISINTQKLSLFGGAQIRASTEGEQPGGEIEVNAEESILLSGVLDFKRVNGPRIFRPSGLSSDANRDNKAGIITINTPFLRIEEGAAIVSNVPEPGEQNQVSSRGVGLSGDIDIETKRLELIRGGQILANANSSAAGTAGEIQIEADSILIEGKRSLSETETRFSSIQAVTSTERGNSEAPASIMVDVSQLTIKDEGTISASAMSTQGGNIRVEVDELSLLNGGQIIANASGEVDETFDTVAGLPGNINIHAKDSILIRGKHRESGQESGVQATSNSKRLKNVPQNEENILITTPILKVEDEGLISANSKGAQGGSIALEVENLSLNRSSRIESNTETGIGGLITLNAKTLVLDQSSQISSNTKTGRGGDIEANVDTLQLLKGGQIAANASGQEGGTPGNIDIYAKNSVLIQGKHSNEQKSGVQATSRSSKLVDGDRSSGNIQIVTPRLTLRNEGVISASSNGARGGNITLKHEDLILDDASRVASDTNTGIGGNIKVEVHKLSLLQGGQIIASAQGLESGTAGNVNIQAKDYIVVLGKNEGLEKNTQFSGIQAETNTAHPTENIPGNITLTTPLLFLQNGALISANSNSTQGGNIMLNISDLLFLNQSSRIVSNAQSGQGGRITVQGFPWIISFPGRNSDITANSNQADGGRIFFNNRGIIGFKITEVALTPNQLAALEANQINDIAASSGSPNRQGEVTINNLDTLTRRFAALEYQVAQPEKLEQCRSSSSGKNSNFKVIGKGGVSVAERDDVTPVWDDIRSLPFPIAHQASKSEPPISNRNPLTIIQANGWIQSQTGAIELISPIKRIDTAMSEKMTATCYTFPQG